MTMALSKVVEEDYRAVICASTGNTSASAAAYAAKAGIRAIVVIPEGKIAMGKLAQAVAYGAARHLHRGQLRRRPGHRARGRGAPCRSRSSTR